MVSYANLGGLGAREGIPVVHTWDPRPPEPPQMSVAAATSLNLLPSLLILLPLFLCRPNRSPKAWWIWLPVGVTLLVGIPIACVQSGQDRIQPLAVGAFVVGLPALWLLMPSLESRCRIIALLKAFAILAGFSLLASVPALLAGNGSWAEVCPYWAVWLALGSLVATLALTLGGLSVRRRFGCVRFLLWLTVWTLLAWTLIATPFVMVIAAQTGNEWGEYLLPVLGSSAATVALLLPLVLLSFFQPFYRARFLDFLNPGLPAARST